MGRERKMVQRERNMFGLWIQQERRESVHVGVHNIERDDSERYIRRGP